MERYGSFLIEYHSRVLVNNFWLELIAYFGLYESLLTRVRLFVIIENWIIV